MIEKAGPLFLIALWGFVIGFGIAWVWLCERRRIKRNRLSRKWWDSE